MKLLAPGAAPAMLASGQNCSNDLEMGSATEARSSAVGTRVKLGVGATWRKSSQFRKKKVLSLRMGPPKVAPTWFRCRGFLAALLRVVKKAAAAQFELLAHST